MYRGFMGRYLLERTAPRLGLYAAASSMPFATFHWHIGLATVMLALGIGIVAALTVLRTRALARCRSPVS